MPVLYRQNILWAQHGKKPSFFRFAWRVLTASLLIPFFSTGFDAAKAQVEEVRKESNNIMLTKTSKCLRFFIDLTPKDN